MSVYATIDDVRDEYNGEIPADSEAYVARKLAAAELIVQRAVGGDIAAYIASGKTSAAEVRLVLCDMVIRLLRNPGGVRTETAGPFSRTIDQSVASGNLWLTRDDKRKLGLRTTAASADLALVDDALRHPLRHPRRHLRDTCDTPWIGNGP